MSKEVKFLAACGAGVNSSHQIKDAVEEEMRKRGYNVKVDAYMVKDVNEELLSHYDGYLTIAKTDLAFTPKVPLIDAGAILYRMPAMAKPVYDNVEKVVKEIIAN
ncbi:PTS fructose transporter subunit IIB [Lactobacillus sp. M0403]|uniref:PTS fructose transporter subunit IIB n=1 Tax=Lactobacillus TaxID=1578 RepID=UPI00164EF2F1|nr:MULTISPECIES: PTS fructose transporter subunit IIB [Lactobacillus]MBC6362056.1 PTS fructose transporter subunit IIB [Lactobacillus apis]MBH9986517.1 PTS fructose transporter subunit IIB [Lactobacillus sp. M0390]MBI0093712.1 PTS fructose transporter subunit IIB [Lactobacillus sp. M0403]MCO6529321.1 PTS fructose transporter subunit IIB [Lactobacillus sp.]MCT6890256.1 PTS fructose transporter subunit IIB [Lactobacillus sp.]